MAKPSGLFVTPHNNRDRNQRPRSKAPRFHCHPRERKSPSSPRTPVFQISPARSHKQCQSCRHQLSEPLPSQARKLSDCLQATLSPLFLCFIRYRPPRQNQWTEKPIHQRSKSENHSNRWSRKYYSWSQSLDKIQNYPVQILQHQYDCSC